MFAGKFLYILRIMQWQGKSPVFQNLYALIVKDTRCTPDWNFIHSVTFRWCDKTFTLFLLSCKWITKIQLNCLKRLIHVSPVLCWYNDKALNIQDELQTLLTERSEKNWPNRIAMPFSQILVTFRSYLWWLNGRASSWVFYQICLKLRGNIKDGFKTLNSVQAHKT